MLLPLVFPQPVQGRLLLHIRPVLVELGQEFRDLLHVEWHGIVAEERPLLGPVP